MLNCNISSPIRKESFFDVENFASIGKRIPLGSVAVDDNTRLTVEKYEPISDDPEGIVVFVHGFAGNRRENGLFSRIAISCLENKLSVLFYDWRGIGESNGDFKHTSIEQHVRDFEQIVKQTTIGNDLVYAVGFSLGAAIVGTAIRHMTRFDRIAYLSPASRPCLSMWPRYNTPEIWNSINLFGYAKKKDSSVTLGKEILESLRDTDLGDTAFMLPIPLLVCHGTADTRVNCNHTRELTKCNSSDTAKFKYLEIPDASHSFRPDYRYWPQIASEVTNWFRKTK